MTWTKLGDEFADDCARAGLSDAAVRTHVEGLIWAMRRETGGYLDQIDVKRAFETADPDAAIAELAAAGFWARHEDGWRIVHAMGDQPEPDLIAARRQRTAERVRRHRRRKAGLDSEGAASNGVTTRVTERVTRVGSGRVLTHPPDPGMNGDQEPDRAAPGAAGDGKPAPSQSRKTREITTARNSQVPDVQQSPTVAPLQGPAADRYAREGAAPLNGTRTATLQRRQARMQRVKAHVAANPGCSGNDLQAAIGGHRDDLLAAMRQLRDDGSVIAERDPADRRIVRYFPNPDPGESPPNPEEHRRREIDKLTAWEQEQTSARAAAP